MADTAYDSDRRRDVIADKTGVAVILNNPSRAMKHPLDKELYAQRHLTECCFSKLKHFRGVATRFEKTERNYLAVVTIAAIVLWIRQVSTRPRAPSLQDYLLQHISGQDGERPEQAEWPSRHHAEEWPGFVEALPVKKPQGVVPATAERMKRHGIETGHDLKSKSLAFLQQHFGKSGPYFYGIARGIDERQVRPDRIRKSVGAEDTFVEDFDDLDPAKAELRPLAGKVWRYARRTMSRERR